MIPITGNDATVSLCETEWKCCRIQEASYARAGRSWMVNIQEQETVRIMERGNKEPANHLLSRGVSGDLQCHATQRNADVGAGGFNSIGTTGRGGGVTVVVVVVFVTGAGGRRAAKEEEEEEGQGEGGGGEVVGSLI
jgi:hypothetical protein